jgi:hypothetical protein
MPESDILNLKLAQQGQIIDQYRANIYNLELRFGLLNKLLEERGVFTAGEFEKRWPLYLKNDIGAMGVDGIMEGRNSVHFYGI